ncbi:RhoGAP-domain-containing protein [Rhizoclosmatium globosum]|uniref:RhoGAP-domain-containing protein n=1 Tax=Rhizoclosmatium globosum TaxID=329046 RepID=A0A1Y2CJQ5_9FUNG|nr:RhoGAP-domain-containing protein [Rhizoclosmatium globosum]|eukprot:ORY47242.1 RhoGAP-domain-containing protein [Rhizoclosmatium globosum]
MTYSALVRRTDKLVDSEYVLVIFSSGSRHKPSVRWILKAYQLLERKFRKNLKRLYIVHPSSWFKLIMQVMGPLISPKFQAKVEWVHNLDILGTLLPLNQFKIPKMIQDADNKRSNIARADGGSGPSGLLSSVWGVVSSIAGIAPSGYASVPGHPATPSLQFGVSLTQLMGHKGEWGIPRVVEECISFILLHGLETEGLFRVSPSLVSVNAVKEKYNNNEPKIDLEEYGGVHTACGLLKLFFRDLPNPIFESSMYDAIRVIQSLGDDTETTQIQFAKEILLGILPVPTLLLLRSLFHLLHTIHKNQAKTLMHSGNLAIVWSPNFVKSNNPMVDLGMCAIGAGGGGIGTLVKICIEQWVEVFGSDDGAGVDADEDAMEGLPTIGDVPVIAEQQSTLPRAAPEPPAAAAPEMLGARSLVLGGERPVSFGGYEDQVKEDEEERDTVDMSSNRRRGSVSADHMDRPMSVDNVTGGGIPAARSRSRGSPRKVSPNRHTIVAGEESAMAKLGTGLSQTTLGEASRQSADGALFRK